MSNFVFNPFGTKSIVLNFICDKCGTSIETDELFVPSPNYAADTSSDSQTETEEFAICDECGKEFTIDIYVALSGANGNVRYLPDSYQVTVFQQADLEENDDWLWNTPSSEKLKTFKKHLKSVDKLLEYQFDEQTQFSFLVMLYAHIIASTELFLSSVFIREVTNSDSLTRKLIETDPEFGDRTFTLKQIYEQHKNVRATVVKYLKDLIFHNIRKIKPMYKDVLGFDFGDTPWLFRAVLKRHDCVHRAGYDKEGNKIEITVKEIRDLMQNCNNLAEEINLHVINKQLS